MTLRKGLSQALTLCAIFSVFFLLTISASAQTTTNSNQLQVNISGSGSIKGAPPATMIDSGNGPEVDPAFSGDDEDGPSEGAVIKDRSIAKAISNGAPTNGSGRAKSNPELTL